MRRALLLIVAILVVCLAWPAMTPGIFNGRGADNLWRMAAETTHDILYRPRVRIIWLRAREIHDDVLASKPVRDFRDQLPVMEAAAMPLYNRMVYILKHRHAPPEWERTRSRYTYAHWMFAVPEPSVWAMMITGFGLAGGMLRRSRAARA